MIKRLKELIQENRDYHKQSIDLQMENYFANRFHDSIRGINETHELCLNIGGWAGNYSFFYLLNRIILNYKFNSIIEFGLGESTKLINAYRKSSRIVCKYTIFEEDKSWLDFFTSNNKLKDDTKLLFKSAEFLTINDCEVNCYQNLDVKELVGNEVFYIIDGPKGSPNYSRYEIVRIAENFNEKTEFLILLDDYNRAGEKQTIDNLIKILESKNIFFKKQVYQASRSQIVIASKKYEYTCSF